jgi:hypothetical protein
VAVLRIREFDEPLPNPSPTRRGADIFHIFNEKIGISKPLSLQGRGMEVGFFRSVELTLRIVKFVGTAPGFTLWAYFNSTLSWVNLLNGTISVGENSQDIYSYGSSNRISFRCG